MNTVGAELAAVLTQFSLLSCLLTFEVHDVFLLSDIPELDGSVLAGRGEHAAALEGLDRGGVEAAVNVVELHVVHGAGVAAQRAEVVEP